MLLKVGLNDILRPVLCRQCKSSVSGLKIQESMDKGNGISIWALALYLNSKSLLQCLVTAETSCVVKLRPRRTAVDFDDFSYHCGLHHC